MRTPPTAFDRWAIVLAGSAVMLTIGTISRSEAAAAQFPRADPQVSDCRLHREALR